MIYDLIVVGSGSVGSAAGWYATQAGLKVLMIDSAHPPHDNGSHHGETRFIRHAYGSGVVYVPMVLRAQQLWYELEQLAGERLMHRCGVVSLGPESSKFMHNIIECTKRYELPVEILTSQEIKTRWPQINVPDGFFGVYEPSSGYLKCELAVKHWIRMAKEAGCKQLFNCPVTGISRDGDMQKVETASGYHLGRKLVLCAGTWLTKLLPDLPIVPTRKVWAWHHADDRFDEKNNFPGFFVLMSDGSIFYALPSNNNDGQHLKLGKHNGGQPINKPEERTSYGSFAEDETEVQDFLHQFFPSIGARICGEACTYDMTPDGDFIIDTQPGDPNRLIISGLSGHGFKFASVLGEIATVFAQDKPMPFDLSPFSLSRFQARN